MHYRGGGVGGEGEVSVRRGGGWCEEQHAREGAAVVIYVSV